MCLKYVLPRLQCTYTSNLHSQKHSESLGKCQSSEITLVTASKVLISRRNSLLIVPLLTTIFPSVCMSIYFIQ